MSLKPNQPWKQHENFQPFHVLRLFVLRYKPTLCGQIPHTTVQQTVLSRNCLLRLQGGGLTFHPNYMAPLNSKEAAVSPSKGSSRGTVRHSNANAVTVFNHSKLHTGVVATETTNHHHMKKSPAAPRSTCCSRIGHVVKLTTTNTT